MSGFEIFDASGETEHTRHLLFKTPSDFSKYIETVSAKEDQTLTQTIIEYCDLRDIDFEDVAPLISKSFKDKLIYEFSVAGLIPKHNELAFE